MSLIEWFRQLINLLLNRKSIPRLILPSYIRLTEIYKYDLRVRMQSQQKLQERPVGYVDLIMPDEDWHNLPNQSPEHDTLIEIVDYQRTDLDARLNRYNLVGQFFPLHQIFQDALTQPEINFERTHLPYRIRIPYAPESPQESIINLQVSIFEEISLKEQKFVQKILDKLQIGQLERDHFLNESSEGEKLIEALVENLGFLSELTIEFDLSLNFPYFSSDESMVEMPNLASMSLTWPINLPRNQVYLEVEKQSSTRKRYNKEIIFDPKNNFLVWRNIQFFLDSQRNTKDLISYRLPKMQLKINNPVELQRQWDSNVIPNFLNDTLSGNIYVHFPGCLLSGLKFDFSDKQLDIDNSIYLESSSKIQGDFTILAQTIFTQRIFSPYQLLQFPNVVLSDMRLKDVMLLLQDMRFYPMEFYLPDGFEVLGIEQNKEKTIKVKRHLIVAQKSIGGKDIILWLIIKGIPSGTVREREIPGNEKFKTPLPTGSMVIYIRGEINEEQDVLIATMTEIHEKLKERFRHVNIIE